MARLPDYQWLILWELDDHPASFWRRGDQWIWTSGGKDLKVTLQIRKLLQLGLLVPAGPADTDVLNVTPEGKRALTLRDYTEVADRWNSR